MRIKHDSISKDTKMADVIFNHHNLILILERFEMKLGVKEKSVGEFCAEYAVSPKVFLMVINLYVNPEHRVELTFDRCEVRQIVNYLTNSHNYYSGEVFPEMIENIHRMSESSRKPELQMVEGFFNEYKGEVDQHFIYENETVFPYILSLISSESEAGNNYSVVDYREHHDDIQEKLDDLKKLLIKHLPANANVKLLRKILIALFDLDFDLNIHSKIENEILIPQVEKLEIESEA